MMVLSDHDRQSGTDNLAGLVERVTFHNSDHGFCVLRVKARGQRDLVTMGATPPRSRPDDHLRAHRARTRITVSRHKLPLASRPIHDIGKTAFYAQPVAHVFDKKDPPRVGQRVVRD